MERSPGQLTAQGRGGILFLIGGVICAIALVMPLALLMTGTPIGSVCGQLSPANVLKIWGLTLAIAAVLSLFGAYYYSRRLTFDGRVLRFTSWIADQAWDADQLGALTHRVEAMYNSDTSVPERYIVLWDRSNRRLGEVSLRGWDTPAVQSVFKAITAGRSLSIAPEVAAFLADPDAGSDFY